MKTQTHLTALLLTGLLAGTAANAAVITWDGGGDGVNWSDGANWSGTLDNTSPEAADDAVFPDAPSGLTTVVDADFGGSIRTLKVEQSTTTQTLAFDLGRTLQIGSSTAPTTRFNHLQYGSILSDAAMIVWNLGGNALTLWGPDDSQTFSLFGTFNLNAAGSAIRSTRQHGTASENRPIFNFGSASNRAVINATADAEIGNIIPASTTGRSSWLCEINIGPVSEVNVSNGATLDLRRRHRVDGTATTLQVNNSGSVDVAGGSTIKVTFTQVNNSNKEVSIEWVNKSAGTVNHVGTVAMSLTERGTATVANEGVWTVSAGAKITGQVTSTGSGDYGTVVFNNLEGGLLTNASDGSLDYDPLTSATYLDQVLTLSNAGMIAPGAGTGGSGTSSVGTFTMTNIHVTNTVTGMLALDIGGTASGTFDKLVLTNGTLDLAAEGDKLQLTFVDGYQPSGGSWTILEYGAVVLGAGDVGFDTIEITNGSGAAAKPAYYSVVYGATSAQLKFAMPGTLILLR